MSETYRILRNQNFLFFLATRFLLTVAIQSQGLGVAWQIYYLTKDPLSLGLVGLFEVIPAFSLSIFAGHWVDQYSRRILTLVGLALQGLASLTLVTLTLYASHFTTAQTVGAIYAAVFMTGIARALLGPSIFALFGDIVPKSQTLQASAWNTTVWQIAASLGPAAGGLIYGYTNALVVYMLSLTCLLIGTVLISEIRIVSTIKNKVHEPFKESISNGLRFVFGHPIILGAMTLDLFAVLFGGAVALFPFFADKLGVGPLGLGWMRAAPFLGAFMMAGFLAHYPPRLNSGKFLLCSVAGFGLCMICFSLSTSFAVSLFILFCSGAFDAVSVMMRGTILQLLTPDSMRGRVASVNSVFIHSSNELGAVESGLTAKWFGTVPSVIIGGCLTIAVVLSVGLWVPRLRRLHLKDIETKLTA